MTTVECNHCDGAQKNRAPSKRQRPALSSCPSVASSSHRPNHWRTTGAPPVDRNYRRRLLYANGSTFIKSSATNAPPTTDSGYAGHSFSPENKTLALVLRAWEAPCLSVAHVVERQPCGRSSRANGPIWPRNTRSTSDSTRLSDSSERNGYDWRNKTRQPARAGTSRIHHATQRMGDRPKSPRTACRSGDELKNCEKLLDGQKPLGGGFWLVYNKNTSSALRHGMYP